MPGNVGAVKTKPLQPTHTNNTSGQHYPNPQQQVSYTTGSKAAIKCFRQGCANPAIKDAEWEDEYCSNECVVIHCRNVFTSWIAYNSKNDPAPTASSTQNSPVPTASSSQNSPAPTPSSTQNSPVPTASSSQNSPVHTASSSQNSPVHTASSSQNSPAPTASSSQNSPVPTASSSHNGSV